jgi:flagellar hook assembly protein FlgD
VREPGTTRARPPLVLRRPAPSPGAAPFLLSYRLDAPATVRLAVYDLAGRCVRVLVHAVEARGDHSCIWDGRDAQGRRVAAGVYWLRLEAGDRHASQPVTLHR